MPVLFPRFPVSETNTSVTLLTLSDSSNGALSRLNNEQKPPHFNGKNLDQLRDESPLNRLGKLEQFALAEKLVEDNIKVYKKSAFATQFTKAVQSSNRSKFN